MSAYKIVAKKIMISKMQVMQNDVTSRQIDRHGYNSIENSRFKCKNVSTFCNFSCVKVFKMKKGALFYQIKGPKIKIKKIRYYLISKYIPFCTEFDTEQEYIINLGV